MNDQPSSSQPPARQSAIRTWLLWIAINLVIVGYFGYAFLGPTSIAKASLLPGQTTHGHYQIELQCNACHDPALNDEELSASNVMSDACNRCHGDQLRKAKDTHPAKKFNDPANADLLAIINAQDCVTCHTEHVPHRTEAMGLTIPRDYCWHCHQDVADDRPSHQNMAFDSCATAGCHNYHDNRAIYEKYLDDHYDEADFYDAATLPARHSSSESQEPPSVSLTAGEANYPESVSVPSTVIADWAETSHAAAGVNCMGCHTGANVDNDPNNSESASLWSDSVALTVCQSCHASEAETFLQGKHGMRLAIGMSPMTPAMARQPMHLQSSPGNNDLYHDTAHRELTCNACHSGHRFDTQYAAVTACQNCHADSHSVAYASSSHAALWQKELAGELPANSGVTCASCHLPRVVNDDDQVRVNHDQNAVLRPNETMARQVCNHCHGLEFSLSSLADPQSLLNCFSEPPEVRTQSVQMAHDYFEQRRQKRKRRSKK